MELFFLRPKFEIGDKALETVISASLNHLFRLRSITYFGFAQSPISLLLDFDGALHLNFYMLILKKLEIIAGDKVAERRGRWLSAAEATGDFGFAQSPISLLLDFDGALHLNCCLYVIG
jgi:hypothetical protein